MYIYTCIHTLLVVYLKSMNLKQWTSNGQTSMHIVLYVGPCTVKTQSLNKPWGNTYLLTFVVGLQNKILHCQILRHDTTRHDTTRHNTTQKKPEHSSIPDPFHLHLTLCIHTQNDDIHLARWVYSWPASAAPASDRGASRWLCQRSYY